MPNKLSRFWKELRRRNVTRVLAVYIAAAFMILELISMTSEPFGMPEGTLKVAFIISLAGFLIAFIIAWIYDIQPEGGIVKTVPAQNASEASAPPSSKVWKIASYISFIVIVGLIALNLFGGKGGVRIDESLAKSIAVLPFENFSTEPDQEAMCLGLTDEIINHLFRIESFDHVSSLTSVLNYKDPEKNIPEIAQELGVIYILEGVYKKVGNQIRVSAQLIKAGSDGHIWQQDYDRPYEEILSLQTEIAIQIADHLNAFITDDEQKKIKKVSTKNLEAHKLIQESKYLKYSYIHAATESEIEYANQAIKLDPEYSEAYAWLGYLLLTQGNVHGNKHTQTVVWEALSYFEKALGMDPNNATAHYGLGWINEFQKYDYISAEKELLKIIELEPNNPVFRLYYTEFLIRRDRTDEAQLSAQKMINRMDYSYLERFWIYGLTGQKDKALVILDSLRSICSKQDFDWVGQSLLHLKEYDSAIYYLDPPPDSRSEAFLALAHHHTNNIQDAAVIITQLKNMEAETTAGSPAFFIGFYYSGINEVDSAFFWLDKAYNNRSPELSWLKTYPEFNSLKKDPRYWDLYERTGHKAYDDYFAKKKK